MSSYDFTNERVFFGKRFGAANFGVVNSVTNAFSDSSIAVQPNTTYVLVARVDYTNGIDTIRLYVNPDLTAAEPTTASASLPWTNTEWSTAVRLASGSGGAVTWDAITVATAWSDLAVVVNTTADEGNGVLGGTQSLREYLKYGAKGATILFAPGLDGATLSLGSEIPVTSGNLVGEHIVDASALSNGITINKSSAGNYRLLNVNSGARLEVRGATFANAGAPTGSLDGGAILNSGRLALKRCTFTGNSAGSGNGGALSSSGAAIVSQCTFSGNAGVFGGAITSASDTRLVHTTVSNNTAAAFGGGIYSFPGTISLLHCTVTGNGAANSGGGIGSTGDSSTHTLVKNSIVSGNAGGDVDFVAGASVNSFTSQGRNLIGTGNATGAFNQTGDIINNLDPLLEPLGSYGGRTQTMPPLAGSAAIDAAVAIVGLDADQRGVPRSRDGNNDATATPDIGAAESAFRFVFNSNNSGAGTLRQALLDAAATPGWESIAFVPQFSGGSITLASEIGITDTAGVAVDASSLTAGPRPRSLPSRACAEPLPLVCAHRFRTWLSSR